MFQITEDLSQPTKKRFTRPSDIDSISQQGAANSHGTLGNSSLASQDLHDILEQIQNIAGTSTCVCTFSLLVAVISTYVKTGVFRSAKFHDHKTNSFSSFLFVKLS